MSYFCGKCGATCIKQFDSITGSTELDSSFRFITTTGNITITLPTAVGIAGREFCIKKIDSDATTLTLATTSSQTIDGSAPGTYTTQWTVINIISDGANWIKTI